MAASPTPPAPAASDAAAQERKRKELVRQAEEIARLREAEQQRERAAEEAKAQRKRDEERRSREAAVAARSVSLQEQDARREEDAAMLAMLLASGQREAAVQLMRGKNPREAKADVSEWRAHSLVTEHARSKGRAPGSTRIASCGEAESVADIDAADQLYIAESLSTFMRPDKKVRARQEATTRDATEFGDAGLLTPQRRDQLDGAAAAMRQLKCSKKQLMKAAGGRHSGLEAKEIVMYALRCPPTQVIAAGADTPTRAELKLMLAEMGLVGDRPLPSGVKVSSWHVATWLVRYILAGPEGLAESSTEAQRAQSFVLARAEQRHRQFIYDAFDPRAYPLAAKGVRAPAAGESYVWYLYCIERREEELHLCRVLWERMGQISESKKVHTQDHVRIKIVKRYLFAHWMLRFMTGIYAEKPDPLFLASPESPLVELCDKDELGGLFDRVLAGKALSSTKK